MTNEQITANVIGFLFSSGITLAVCKGFLKSQVEEVVKPILDDRDSKQLERCNLRQKIIDNEITNYREENNRLSDALIRLEGKVDSIILMFTNK